jgi:sensor c-di-GMP phosphodiesterase-like protein
MTAGRLAHEAARVMSESDTYALEVHRTLDAVNASRYPYCSEEDMELLSHLLDTSRFLKEIGRIHDNKIVCSTMLGREHLSNNELPKPDSIGTDAVKAFRDSPIFRLPNIKGVVALQAGDSYVVLYPYFDSLREPSPIHRKITTVSDDERKHPIALTGVSEQPAWPQLTRNNDFRVGETMFSTRCSLLSINHICTTAYLSVSEALQANHRGLRVFIAFGGLAGAFFGFFCSVIYWRNQSMEQQLRRAIHRDQLSVVYQPIVNVASRRMVGAEALARWTDEEGVAIGPDIFIKIAEERGFVGEITRLVVQRVLCEFGATLRDNPDFHVSINVAAADLEDPGFPSMLEQSLEQASVSTESVAIELTERGTARHNVAAEAIRQLRQRGHSVHIDDRILKSGLSARSFCRRHQDRQGFHPGDRHGGGDRGHFAADSCHGRDARSGCDHGRDRNRPPGQLLFRPGATHLRPGMALRTSCSGRRVSSPADRGQEGTASPGNCL